MNKTLSPKVSVLIFRAKRRGGEAENGVSVGLNSSAGMFLLLAWFNIPLTALS